MLQLDQISWHGNYEVTRLVGFLFGSILGMDLFSMVIQCDLSNSLRSWILSSIPGSANLSGLSFDGRWYRLHRAGRSHHWQCGLPVHPGARWVHQSTPPQLDAEWIAVSLWLEVLCLNHCTHCEIRSLFWSWVGALAVSSFTLHYVLTCINMIYSSNDTMIYRSVLIPVRLTKAYVDTWRRDSCWPGLFPSFAFGHLLCSLWFLYCFICWPCL